MKLAGEWSRSILIYQTYFWCMAWHWRDFILLTWKWEVKVYEKVCAFWLFKRKKWRFMESFQIESTRDSVDSFFKSFNSSYSIWKSLETRRHPVCLTFWIWIFENLEMSQTESNKYKNDNSLRMGTKERRQESNVGTYFNLNI